MNAYVLTTVARVKSFLGLTGSTYDSVFELLIDVLTDFTEKECDRRFKLTAYTGTVLNGDGTNQSVLPQWPVSSTATFKLYERDSLDYGDDSWDEVNADDYRIDYDSGIVTANFTFTKGFQNYKVDYSAGYDFENVSGTLKTLSSVGLSDLEFACWKLISRAFAQRKGGGDIASMRLYNYSVTFSKEAYSDDEIKEVLSKYKRFSF